MDSNFSERIEGADKEGEVVKISNTPKDEKIISRKLINREQFKCRTCEKFQNCYGSRYCQNEFNPVSIVTAKIKSE